MNETSPDALTSRWRIDDEILDYGDASGAEDRCPGRLAQLHGDHADWQLPCMKTNGDEGCLGGRDDEGFESLGRSRFIELAKQRG